MKIKNRILIQTLSAFLALTIILGVIFFLSVASIRKTVLTHSNILGDSAAGIGAYALEIQLSEKVRRIAQDSAFILDERLKKIENHTRTTADITGSIYATRQGWVPRPLPLVKPGEIPPPQPYLRIAPGIDYSRIRGEVELAGNIGDVLRQIMVIDRGISTSTICGESGYVIAMDVNPWPAALADPRTFNWYMGAQLAGGLYWTDIHEDHRGRGAVITCAVPFYDNSAGDRVFKGVARSTLRLSDFSQIIDSTGIGAGKVFILNRDGIKIHASDGVDITIDDSGIVGGENFFESPSQRVRSLGLSMTLGASGMTELEMDGVSVYVAYAPIRTLGWSLGIAVSIQEISAAAFLIEDQIWRITDNTKAEMDRYIFLLAGFIALLLLFALMGITVFSVRFTQAITGPILALSKGVDEVAGGNLEREVVVKTGDELEQLAVSFNMMTAQLRNHIAEIARTTAERQRMVTELEIATRIQEGMLPMEFPPFRGRANKFDLYAQIHPAREVGGDFFDFFFVDDDHFAVIIADVSGKGIPAALFMAITKTLIKNRLQSGENPVLSLEIINRQLCGNNNMEMFVTLWLSVLEISSNRLVFINAGHNQPLIRRQDQGFAFLVSPPDLVLAGMDDTRYHSREMWLKDGDLLFLYTDGITEAANAVGEFYGNERLRQFLDANAGLPLKELLPCLRSDIAAFAGEAEQSDDITMLALQICRGMGESAQRSITLTADIANMDELNAFVKKDMDSYHCPEHICGQIELAVEEIFVNIASYAYGEEHGEVTVECTVDSLPGKITMTLVFCDHGRAFNPLEYAEPDINLPLESRKPGGLGLLIVKRTMDTIQYSREGGMNHLKFSKSWQ